MARSEVKRALIVEDDEATANAYRALIRHCWPTAIILWAKTRQEARALCHPLPDAFLVDVRLGGDNANIDGMIFIMELRADGIQTPVVVLSGHLTLHLALELEALGVVPLPKPAAPADIKRALLTETQPTPTGRKLMALLANNTTQTVLPRPTYYHHILHLLRVLPGSLEDKFADLRKLDMRTVVKATGSLNKAAAHYGVDRSNFRRMIRSLALFEDDDEDDSE